jgi:hypothetical protein
MTVAALGLTELLTYSLSACGISIHTRKKRRQEALGRWRPGPRQTPVLDRYS